MAEHMRSAKKNTSTSRMVVRQRERTHTVGSLCGGKSQSIVGENGE